MNNVRNSSIGYMTLAELEAYKDALDMQGFCIDGIVQLIADMSSEEYIEIDASADPNERVIIEIERV